MTTTASGTGGGNSAAATTLSIGGTVIGTCGGGGGGALGGTAIVAGSTAYGMVTATSAGLEGFAGQSGGNGLLLTDLLVGGQGGSSLFGMGGLQVLTANVSGAESPGNAPTFYGAGGSGATGTGTGGNGGPGIIKMWLFG